MTPRGASPAILRVALILSTLTYAYALHDAHVRYLRPNWEYYGFTYRPPGPGEIAFGLILLIGAAIALPSLVNRPSSVILLCLYAAFYVPAVVMTLSVDTDRMPRYIPILTSLFAVFVVAGVASRWRFRRRDVRPRMLPDTALSFSILIVWATCAAVLIAIYHSIMSLVSLGDVYGQRAAGASTNAAVAYVQTYFSYVLSIGLIAIGLARSRSAWVLFGTAGCLIMYMIDAQRTVFLLPAAMVAMHFALIRRSRYWRATALPLSLLTAAVFFGTRFVSSNRVANVICEYVTLRTLAFPGLTYSLYYDLFSADGFTWWSHVKGLSAIIPVPAAYANSPYWPRLGYIVADRVYHVQSNANANLFSSDGVAAAGAVGTLVIGLIFIGYLVVIDRVSAKWRPRFSLLVALPIGIILVNCALFSFLLSFGGIFWTAVLYFYSSAAADRAGASAEISDRLRRAARLRRRKRVIARRPARVSSGATVATQPVQTV